MSRSRRRAEGIPLLEAKFKTNLAPRFAHKQQGAILAVSMDQAKLEAMPVNECVDPYT
jgi:2-methylcitrate dehydratase